MNRKPGNQFQDIFINYFTLGKGKCKMKTSSIPLMASIILLLFVFNSLAEESLGDRYLDLGIFSISDDIPTSWILAHTSYKNNQIITERLDLLQDIRERERQNVWIWSAKVFCSDFMFSTKGKNIFFVSGIGEHKDDAGVFKWSYNRHHPSDPRYDSTDQYDIELIDSRIITYLVRHDSFPEKEILDIFKEVVQYYASSKNDSTIIPIESHILSDGSSYGKLIVKRITTGWFIKPIEWYKKDDNVLFAFEKVVDMPMGKAFPDIDHITYKKDELVGGIPYYDKRSYLRFENSNRKKLIEDYFEDYYFEEAEKFSKWFIENNKPGETHGKFAGTK